MGEWEKIQYRNVKRNYKALIAIGNRKCWVPVSLGNMKQVFTWLALRWLHLLTVPFCVETNLEEMFTVLYQREVDPEVQSSRLDLF